jgi:hypothetical protein
VSMHRRIHLEMSSQTDQGSNDPDMKSIFKSIVSLYNGE